MRREIDEGNDVKLFADAWKKIISATETKKRKAAPILTIQGTSASAQWSFMEGQNLIVFLLLLFLFSSSSNKN